jgi:uncharacterized protein YacL
VLGLLLGYLVGGRPADAGARALDGVVRRFAKVPPEAVLAAGTGATVALLITVLLNNVLAPVPGFTWYWSLLIATVLIAPPRGSSSSTAAVRGRARPRRRSHDEPPAGPATAPKVLDTSAIIDGRLVEVADANFLEGTLLVPQFVLAELQRIADADDPLKRRRGRRGLEVLDRLVAHAGVQTEVVHDEAGDGPVDDRLVRLCAARGADLVTTDYNLHRVAGCRGSGCSTCTSSPTPSRPPSSRANACR